jgi:hypothetical protein
VSDMGPRAREMWTLFEPVHAVCYFSPQAQSAFGAAGLRGFWRGYFAGRAAPLGTVGADVVTASFYNFAPSMVARAIPAVWDLITPAEALRVRADGAVTALRGLLAELEPRVGPAADRLWAVASGLDCAGRVLAAANAALPEPEDDFARLWQAATTLREHRGDGHWAALLAAGIDGCEVLVLRSAIDMERGVLQAIRRWSDEQWQAARARLTERGYLGADGEPTEAGRIAQQAVEEVTDLAAARPWAELGDAAAADLAALLTPIALACATVIPYPSPMGVPAPAAGR